MLVTATVVNSDLLDLAEITPTVRLCRLSYRELPYQRIVPPIADLELWGAHDLILPENASSTLTWRLYPPHHEGRQDEDVTTNEIINNQCYNVYPAGRDSME